MFMRGASPEAMKALLDMTPYVSSEYVNEVSDMCGSFRVNRNGVAEDYNLRSFVDEYGTWSVAPVARAIHDFLDDEEVIHELSYASAMHKAFPNVIDVMSLIKDVFILETIVWIFSIDLTYIHARVAFTFGHVNCAILDSIISVEGVDMMSNLLLGDEQLGCLFHLCSFSAEADIYMCSDLDLNEEFDYTPYESNPICCYSDYFCS